MIISRDNFKIRLFRACYAVMQAEIRKVLKSKEAMINSMGCLANKYLFNFPFKDLFVVAARFTYNPQTRFFSSRFRSLETFHNKIIYLGILRCFLYFFEYFAHILKNLRTPF